MQQLAIRTTFTADIFVTSNDGAHTPGQPVYTDHVYNVEVEETFALTASTLNGLLHAPAATADAAISDWAFLEPVIPNVDCNPRVDRAQNFTITELLTAHGAAASYSIQLELTVKLRDEEKTYPVLRAAVPVSKEFLNALIDDDRRAVADALDAQSLLEAQYPDYEGDTIDTVLGMLVLDVSGTFAA